MSASDSFCVRVSAVSVAIVLHALVIAAGAWVTCGGEPETWTSLSSGSYEARLVDRAEPDDAFVVEPPRPDGRDAVPAARGDDFAPPALDPELADEAPPPAAAPSIAVLGGRHAPPPREWSSRPSVGRSAFAGAGHGSRREGGQGRGRVAAAPVAAPAPPQAAVHVETRPAAPPARIDARVVAYEPPDYPETARDRNLEGSVKIEVEVLEDGTAGEVRVVVSSGFRIFDDAAAAAVRRWRFAPATVDGVAVVSTLALPPIRFRLE